MIQSTDKDPRLCVGGLDRGCGGALRQREWEESRLAGGLGGLEAWPGVPSARHARCQVPGVSGWGQCGVF